MIKLVKKSVALAILFALSLNIACPSQAQEPAKNTSEQTKSSKLKNAKIFLDKQWKKIKPCIKKGNCSKKQIAAFTGAVAVIIGLILGTIHRKRIGKWWRGARVQDPTRLEQTLDIDKFLEEGGNAVGLANQLLDKWQNPEALLDFFKYQLELQGKSKDDIAQELRFIPKDADAFYLQNRNRSELSSISKDNYAIILKRLKNPDTFRKDTSP